MYSIASGVVEKHKRENKRRKARRRKEQERSDTLE